MPAGWLILLREPRGKAERFAHLKRRLKWRTAQAGQRIRPLTVVSYYDTGSDSMVSQNGHVVLARVVLKDKNNARQKIVPILETVRAAEADANGFEISILGNTSLNREVDQLTEEDFGRIMLITLGLGLIIMLIAFRAVVAATIPLILALGAIFSATAVAALVSQVYPLSESYSEMILLMGMAVGIDYSLFIVSRFRSERRAGRPKLEVIGYASDTTGRAVFYAGVTVVFSLASLALTNNPIFISLALAAIIVVLLAMAGAMTVVPALLSVLGDNVNRFKVPVLSDAKAAMITAASGALLPTWCWRDQLSWHRWPPPR